MQFENSTKLCEHVRAISGDTVILAFSCGKDALAAWSQIRRHFSRIVLYHLYLVPGLKFVERSVEYYEAKLGSPIIMLPHPSLPRMLRNLVFQPPERAAAIEAMGLPNLTYEQIADEVRRIAGCPDAWVANGSRAADSPGRLMAMRTHGPLNERKRTFFPVYDWKIADVTGALEREDVKLPIDYKLFGRSFDGIDYRFLRPIKDHLPEDYARIKAWFPLVDVELFRRGDAA